MERLRREARQRCWERLALVQAALMTAQGAADVAMSNLLAVPSVAQALAPLAPQAGSGTAR